MNVKYIALFVVLIIAGVLIFFFTQDENKDTNTTTTTNQNTGLAALNLGGMFGGLFGGGGSNVISQDNSYVPNVHTGDLNQANYDPRTGEPEPRST